MFRGFDPRANGQLFFERRRSLAYLAALTLYASVLGWGLVAPHEEETVAVALEPEIKDFKLEEPEEPEVEEEPPPPPPKNVKTKVVSKPKPQPQVRPPDQPVTDVVEESDRDKVVEVAGGPSSAHGTGNKAVKKVEKPKPKPEPKPEAKKVAPKVDPTKPIDRPEGATNPKPDAGNPSPEYPKELRDQGITGEVVVKLHIHRDGTVKGMKVLRKSNTASSEEDQARASKLFLAAIIKVVQTWKYTPAKLSGEPISIWYPVTIPFKDAG